MKIIEGVRVYTMIFDLTFEEAVDVLQSRVGWVQGEKFEKDEYLAIDRRTNMFIKNFLINF